MLLSIFIRYPWLALVPAALFASLYASSRRAVVAVTAVAWLAYAGYEYAMQQRWLCTGECNIRVDLLLIYPAAVLLSLAAAAVGITTMVRARKHPRP